MKLILRKKDGYILAWVLCIFLVVSVISTLIVSYAFISSATTEVQHKTQQVYFTAKSAANSVIDYIIENSSTPSVIESLKANPGTGSIPGMGDYTVEVTEISESKIKVKATASYHGETATASAYLIKPPAPSGVIPTDNLIFLNGSGASGFGQATINGNIYINGDFNLAAGSKITGYTVVKGNTTISGAGATTKGLFGFGNVHLTGSGAVDGDVYTKGDLKLDGSGRISGNAYADGSLEMWTGSGRISGNAVIGNNARFSGGGPKIDGTLTYGGDVSVGWGSVTDFVPKGATKSTGYTPINDGPYGAQALPNITVPSDLFSMSAVTISNYTISNSGKITSSTFSGYPWGSTFTIDATSKDIKLLLDNTHLNLPSGYKILVNSDGTHNVYIYLTGASSITINSNEYVGMKVTGTNPRLYILGDGEQSVNLYSNSELDACIYIPNGTFTAAGSSYDEATGYKFVGSCVVKSVNISSDVYLHYSEPDIDQTPLDVFVSGGSAPSNTPWVIESWENH